MFGHRDTTAQEKRAHQPQRQRQDDHMRACDQSQPSNVDEEMCEEDGKRHRHDQGDLGEAPAIDLMQSEEGERGDDQLARLKELAPGEGAERGEAVQAPKLTDEFRSHKVEGIPECQRGEDGWTQRGTDPTPPVVEPE